MARCIQLARGGRKNAAPNPMVGAVVVHDGRIIGEGYHVRCGEPHAEVNALRSVRPDDEPLLAESTIYVSLEPCAHYGKTPPCADLIIRRGLRRCVVGCVDPFAQVHGLGISKLREAGIDVTVGVLEAQCQQLNSRFMTFHRLQRPFVTLKWAQTADRFIGYEGQTPDRPLRISNTLTRALCHKRRAEHQAILVGTGTLRADAPALTVRDWPGDDPRRVILSRANGTIEAQLRHLWEDGVQSVLVEGGRTVLESFMQAGCWDEAFVETSPHTLAALAGPEVRGVAAPQLLHAEWVAADTSFGHLITQYRHAQS